MPQSEDARFRRAIRIADTMRTKKQMRNLLSVIEQAGDPFAGVVRRKGQWFRGRNKAGDHKMAADWQKNKRPEPNECFYNAQLFCHGHPEVRYFEGYLWIAGLPLHHAWNLLPDGIHIDFTVEAMERKLTPEQRAVDPREPLYCGVEVPRAHVRTRMLDAGATEPLAELYMALVKKKRPTDIAKANSAD